MDHFKRKDRRGAVHVQSNDLGPTVRHGTLPAVSMPPVTAFSPMPMPMPTPKTTASFDVLSFGFETHPMQLMQSEFTGDYYRSASPLKLDLDSYLNYAEGPDNREMSTISSISADTFSSTGSMFSSSSTDTGDTLTVRNGRGRSRGPSPWSRSGRTKSIDNPTPSFVCLGPQCQLAFSSDKELKSHVKSSHTHICNWAGCDQPSFSTRDGLIHHVKVQHLVICPSPGCTETSFQSIRILQSHISMAHPEDGKDDAKEWELPMKAADNRDQTQEHLWIYRIKMEFKFKPQKTPHIQPHRTQKAQKPSSLAFVNVDNPTQAKDRATLQKVRRHVMKDIGRSRRSRQSHDLIATKPLYQVEQMPTYWGDVQVCVNVKRVFWAMEMVSGALLSITVVDPAIRDRQKITRRQDEPPSLRDIELYTNSLGTVRKSILAESQIRRRAIMGTVICLSMFDMRVGNLSSWTMHMAGLQMMLDLTGGVESLDSTSPLRQALFLADLFGCLKQDISPKFPSLHLQFEPQAILSPYTRRLVDSLERMHLSEDTPTVIIRNSFAYASRVAALLNKQWAENPTDSSFVLPTCSLAHQALSLPRWDLITGEGRGAMAQVSALAELVRIATLSLFCIIVSQTSGDIGYIIPRRDVPFQYLMSLIDGKFWEGKLKLKLWLLVNQFCVESGFSRIWYLEQIVDTMSQVNICCWKDLMSCLREVVWIEGLAPLDMSELRLYVDKQLS